MITQSHKMTVSVDEHSSHLETFRLFFKRLDEEGVTIEKLPRDRIQSYQLKAVNATLAHAWDRNAFYHKKLEDAGFYPSRHRHAT
ncbi:hypothetical protein MO973_10960 [Paenibacillus sp. TRM 82003]|nr:hypothetical protein [Paenibacillus sp. TRM 82003]